MYTDSFWIILIYKCKLYQQINEQYHGEKGCHHMPTAILVLIGHLSILTVTFQCCSLTNVVTQKETLAKEQSWDVSIDTKFFI